MITPAGFGSSQPRFQNDQKNSPTKKKTSAVRRSTGNQGKLKKNKWAKATLYVRTKPWDTAIPFPRNALVLVEKIIPGEDGDDDEIEYETFFYNKNGKLINKLNATISLDNNNDFKARDYAHIKKILAGKENGFEHNTQGAVPTDLSQNGIMNTEELIHALIAIARERAKIKKRGNYGFRGGIFVALIGLFIGILAVTGVIELPNWLSILSLISGGYAFGKTALTLYYDHKNKCVHKTNSILCPDSNCCNSKTKKNQNQLESLSIAASSPSIGITLNSPVETKHRNEQDTIAQRFQTLGKADCYADSNEIRLEIASPAGSDSFSAIAVSGARQQPTTPSTRGSQPFSASDATQSAIQQGLPKRSPSPEIFAPKRRQAPIAIPALPLNTRRPSVGASLTPVSTEISRTKRSGSLKGSGQN